MFEITIHTEQDYPNAFAKAEKERPWTTRCGDNEWRVVPRKLKDGSREHGKYVVRIRQWGKRVFADCVNVLTGEPCESTRSKGRFCYHCASVLRRCRQVQSRKAA